MSTNRYFCSCYFHSHSGFLRSGARTYVWDLTFFGAEKHRLIPDELVCLMPSGRQTASNIRAHLLAIRNRAEKL
jgi:hypothetical protein